MAAAETAAAAAALPDGLTTQGVGQFGEGELRSLAQTPGVSVVGMQAGRQTVWRGMPADQKRDMLQELWDYFDAYAEAHPDWEADRIRRHMRDECPRFALHFDVGKHIIAMTCRRIFPEEDLRAQEVRQMRNYMLDALKNFKREEQGELTADERRAVNEGMSMALNLRPREAGEGEGAQTIDLTPLAERAGYDVAELEDAAQRTLIAQMRAAGISTGSTLSVVSRQSDTARALPEATAEDTLAAAADDAAVGLTQAEAETAERLRVHQQNMLSAFAAAPAEEDAFDEEVFSAMDTLLQQAKQAMAGAPSAT